MLSKEDIDAVRNGWFTIIPRFPQKTLVFVDTTKLEGDPIDERLRAVFFMSSLLGTHSAAQKDGIVILHNNVHGRWQSLESLGVLLEILHRGTAVRVAKSVILRSRGEERGSTADIRKS